MVPWKLQSSTEALGRAFTRPMGMNELGFYYDACYNLTADIYFHCAVETEGTRGDDLFRYENIFRTWKAVKQRYPLSGAKIQGDFGTDAVEFVVSEKLLAGVVPGELNFSPVNSAEDIDRMIDDMIHGTQRDLHNLPFRLIVLHQLDQPHRWHVIFNCMHSTGDAISSANFHCMFFDVLALGISPVVPDLQERLAVVVPTEDLNPTRKMSVARQRWRYAMASVLYTIRDSKIQVRTLMQSVSS